MAKKDFTYTDRELDQAFNEVRKQIDQFVEGAKPFEKDMRESQARLEMGLSNIQIVMDKKLQEEREKTDKSYAPIILWPGFLALAGIVATLELPALLTLLHLLPK